MGSLIPDGVDPKGVHGVLIAHTEWLRAKIAKDMYT